MEESVLGALMLRGGSWDLVQGLLREEDFYLQQHRLIFRGIAELAAGDKPRDFQSVAELLRLQERLEPAGGIAYLGTLANDTPSAANVRHYAERVKHYALLRELIAAAGDIAGMGYEPGTRDGESLLQAAEERLGRVARTRQVRAQSLKEVIDLADKAIQQAAARREQGLDRGIPSGMRCVDERTGGWGEGALVVIAARPSLGKTALLNQFAVHAARRGHAGLICSLEMSPEMLGIRAMAAAAGVNVTKLSCGYKKERDAACAAAVELGALPLYIDTDSYTLSSICAQISDYRRRYGIQWAAVDHIGLVEADGFAMRNDQMGHITRSLKKLAKRLRIPVIALSQLNRSVEKERRRPVLADLRDSGNIEQDADVCLFLHSEADDSQPVIGMQLGLLKNRGGRRGWIGKTVHFDGRLQRFEEAA
jgi:replicative DNA helicase